MNLHTRLSIAVALTIWLPLGHAFADEQRQYTWLTVGKPSGQQTVSRDASGAITVEFEFNDRGRGPKHTTQLRLNERGAIVELRIEGNNYQKSPVDERLDVKQDTVAWSSNIEQGSADFDGNAFFWPYNAPPEVLAMLARALLSAPDDGLALLPTGRATLDKVATTTVEHNGASLPITLYGINGLDSSPTYVWLDGERQFFGVDYGWFGITRAGFESHIDTLKAMQTAATDAFYEQATKTLTRPLDELLVIRGARIFDSIAGTLTDPATVFVFDGKITAIYFDAIDPPQGATVIDAAGQTLLPTLWDMHAHVRVGSYLNYLASGVTNVRDMANDHDSVLKLRTDVRSGKIAGPDVHALGFVDKRGEYAAPTGRLADTLNDARELIDFYAQHGYHGIKLYSSIEPGWVAPLASYAHRHDLTVKGHVPAFMTAAQAINAGYDEITHINMILLNFLGAETLDTRTPNRFTVPGERGGDIDLNSQPVVDFINLMKSRDIAIDPTLTIFMNLFLNEPGQVSPAFRDIADHLPATARRQAIAGTSYNDGKEAAFKSAAANTLLLTRKLHEAGVRILPGTDNALPGFTLIRELAYYVEAGIPANEALQLATIGAARHLSLDQRLGSITVGKAAHLYLVDGDPVADINALYRVRHVIKERHMYFAPDVLRSQGFSPF